MSGEHPSSLTREDPPRHDDQDMASSQDQISSENNAMITPDISQMALNDPSEHRRRPGQATTRSVSDTGPLRPGPVVGTAGSLSAGAASPLAHVQAARAGRPPSSSGSSTSNLSGGVSKLPAGMQAKMMAFHASRSSRSSSPSVASDGSGVPSPSPSQSHRPTMGLPRTTAPAAVSGAVFGPRMGLASPRPSGLNRRAGLGMKLSNVTGGTSDPRNASLGGVFGSDFQKWSQIVDTQNSLLRFSGKAILHSEGVDFSSGESFSLRLTDLLPQEELGKGNYGTVVHVIHRVTNAHMAMKQIKLELDNSKFMAIITELQVLHEAKTDLIVDFYGGFFAESCVFICMEYMDGGSLDKLVPTGVGIRDEKILAWVTSSTVRGLKYLKDNLNIIHRDVKPTNILVNTKGDVKLCDFGVSGNLVASLAKTNIGCQSYMAPERIRGGDAGSIITYSVQSDIWSLGLSILEIAKGVYPYPPETYNSVFAQLSAIVDGEPPVLPDEFSAVAQGFVRQCLNKIPRKRPTFNALLEHPWLLPLSPLRPDFAEVEVANKQMLGEWVTESIAARHAKDSSDTDEEKAKPPLHTVKTEVNKEVNEVNSEPDTTP